MASDVIHAVYGDETWCGQPLDGVVLQPIVEPEDWNEVTCAECKRLGDDR